MILVKNNILGTEVTNATEEQILEYILNFVQHSSKRGYIVTPNPEIVVYACKHKSFKNILNNAEISLADGVGLLWAGKLLGKPFKSRVTGTDLLEKLCRKIEGKPITIGFLGAQEGVAERAAECLLSRYPNLKISFVASELSDLESNSGHVSRISYKVFSRNPNIQNTKYKIPNIDLLFVAYGFPKQEEFMAKNIGKLPVKMMMGVGGAFDYISGSVPRAPLYLQTLGFEWLFRLTVQPWRLRRQLALLEFILLVLKERIMV